MLGNCTHSGVICFLVQISDCSRTLRSKSVVINEARDVCSRSVLSQPPVERRGMLWVHNTVRFPIITENLTVAIKRISVLAGRGRCRRGANPGWCGRRVNPGWCRRNVNWRRGWRKRPDTAGKENKRYNCQNQRGPSYRAPSSQDLRL